MGDDGLHDIGCSAHIDEVLERMDDGRLNIAVRGTEPFRLSRRIDDMEYPAGDIELLDDDDQPEAEAAETAHESYATLVERVTDKRPEPGDIDGLGAYEMAATIAFDLDEKQELLELRSESERLNRLASLCSEALERLDHAEVAAERAQTNGRVHH
jgi:ATP-dependent Lon protease